jgi:segregation and condensation protein B
MEIKSAQAAIEAILFASGEPVPVERLIDALEIDKQTVRRLLSMIEERINSLQGGLCLIRTEDAYQLTTRPEYAEYIRRALDIKRNMPLSQAAMEALAIVAYSQPVTKGYIEEVRGVDCSGIMSNLVAKGLIEEQGRLEVPGRPILYGTTPDFLRCFGLASISELPPVQGLTAQEPEAAAACEAV